MNILVAGGSGAIGIPLVQQLVAAGHHVTALARSPGKEGALRALGATPAIADALDHDALMRAVAVAHPAVVIHQLTALPTHGPRRRTDLEATNRLRIDGTRNLLDAAITAGTRRFVVGSFAMLSPREPRALPADPAAEAVRSMESQVLEATRAHLIEGVILRYGLFYGPDNAATLKMVEMIRRRWLPVIRGDAGQLPYIHIDDAVSATIAALDRAPAGSLYDIVDDQPVSLTDIVTTIAQYTGSAKPLTVPAWLPRLIAPYMARLTSLRMPLSNQKAKLELGWQPRYSTVRDGLAQMLRHAA